MFNIINHETGFKIDFILRKDTEYFNLAFSRRKHIYDQDTWLWVKSLEDLILIKLIWIQQLQSEKQINDIQNLLLIPEKDIDYIKLWCNKLNLNTFKLLENE